MPALEAPPAPRRAPPLGWLLLVLLAHLALLARPLPAPSEMPPPPTPAALQTRQVSLAAVTPSVPAVAATSPPPRAPRPAMAPPAIPPRGPAPETAPAPEAAAPTPQPPQPPEPPEPEVAVAAAATPPPSAPVTTDALAGQPLALPGSTRLHYRVEVTRHGNRTEATGVLHWDRDGDRYELNFELRAFIFSRQQTSTGRIAPDGLHPQRFAERSRSERAAHFDEAQGRVRFSANTPDAPLLPGTQDRVSLFLQLAARFATQPAAFAPGTTLRVPVVGARDLQEWVLTVEEEEQLQLPDGPLPAVRLLRLPRREHDQKVEIWLAPGLGYLPARIRLTEANGDIADQLLLAGR